MEHMFHLFFLIEINVIYCSRDDFYFLSNETLFTNNIDMY
jgi:hypothetical protein